MAWTDEARRKSAEVRRLKALMKKGAKLRAARVPKAKAAPKAKSYRELAYDVQDAANALYARVRDEAWLPVPNLPKGKMAASRKIGSSISRLGRLFDNGEASWNHPAAVKQLNDLLKRIDESRVEMGTEESIFIEKWPEWTSFVKQVRAMKTLVGPRARAADKRARAAGWKPFMTPAEAVEWTKNSAYKKTVVRVGEKLAFEGVKTEGFNTHAEGRYSMHAEGAYFATDVSTIHHYSYGPVSVLSAFKVNVKNPLKVVFPKYYDPEGPMGPRERILKAAGLTPDEIAKLRPEFNDLSAQAVTDELQKRGYDSIEIIDESGWSGTPGGSQVVVFDRENIVMLDGSGKPYTKSRVASMFKIGMEKAK
jgi:hypothetical protein